MTLCMDSVPILQSNISNFVDRQHCRPGSLSCETTCFEDRECSVYQLCSEGGYCESPGGSECVTHDDCKIPRLYFCNPHANDTCTLIDKTGSPCRKQDCGKMYRLEHTNLRSIF